MRDEPPPSPRITPYLLRRAGDLCPRRLACDMTGEAGSSDPVNRGRVRDAFLLAARTVHSLPGPPVDGPWRAPHDLLPEELAVFDQAVHWYRRLFGERSVALFDHDLDRPSEVPGLDVRLGGWVDLTVVDPDGRRELRQLDFWARPVPDDPFERWEVRLAALRLADWLGAGPASASWTDLLHGVRVERAVDAGTLAEARDALDERLAVVRARAATAEPQPGADCGTCRWHKGCPEFPRAMRVGRSRADDLRPGLLRLTPSALEAWHRCRRLWRAQYLLSLPPSDSPAPSAHGHLVHDLLRLLHAAGPCDHPERIDDVVAAHGGDARVRTELRDHARRCPAGARALGHEFTRVRLHPRHPSFVATARVDAAWIHDGLLDVRDYKTGALSHDRLADDPRARLQAWVMQPVAESLGLALRLRYEYLATEIAEDPDDWEPDAADLDAVEADLVSWASEMRAESEWAGVADPAICRTCRYRSICPHSATPGEPEWPRIADAHEDHGDDRDTGDGDDPSAP